MHVERHVFGSFKGYTTLARTPGISIEDAKTLEGSAYAFGQTQDRRYLKSLKGSPAYFTRLLRAGRRGLTRVLEGNPDDNGRPTLCMITAVISQREWDNELAGDVNLLLSDPAIWQWKPNTALEPIDKPPPAPELSISRAAGARVAELISQLECAMASGHGVVVSAREFGEDELRAVEMLIPPAVRAQFTSANRSLSSKLAVTLNCVAPEAPDQKLSYRLGGDTTPSPFAQFLLSSGLSSGRLPVAEVITYRTFGKIARAASADVTVAPPPPPPPLSEKKSTIAVIAAGLFIAILFFGGGFWSGRRSSLKTAAAVLLPSTVPSPRPSSQLTATQPIGATSDPKKAPAVATPITPTTQRNVPTSNRASSAPVDPEFAHRANAAVIKMELDRAAKDAEAQRSAGFQEEQVQIISDTVAQMKLHRDLEKDHLRIKYISRILERDHNMAPDPTFKMAEDISDKYVKAFQAYTTFKTMLEDCPQKELSAEDASKIQDQETVMKDAMEQLNKAMKMPDFKYHEVLQLENAADGLRKRSTKPNTTQK